LVVSIRDTAENAPISDGYVLVHSYSGQVDVRAKSVGNGRYDIALARGWYDMLAGAKGFVPDCRVLEVSSDVIAPIVVTLQVDNEHMQISSSARR
jgi:hypothetical protein